MFKNVKISSQLIALVGIFSAALIGLGAMSWHGQSSTVQSLNAVYKDQVVPLRQLTTIANEYAVNIVDTAHKVRDRKLSWGEAQNNVTKAVDTIKLTWEAYLSTTNTEAGLRLIDELEQLKQVADQSVGRLRGIFERRDAQGLDQFISDELYQTIDPVSERFAALMDIELDVADRTYRQAADQYVVNRNLTIAVMAAGLLLGIVLAWGIISRLSRLLGQAVQALDGIADANLTQTLPEGGRNEIGRLLTSMGRMQASLNDIVSNVREGSQEIYHGTREIASGNADLSSRTEQQAASIEETAASMEEMTATVKQNADNARQASTLAADASSTAERGGDVVEQVVKTMHGISTSSQKVADITGVIDSIAFQTNILALNASVEAARAGEQGRGFAVVAGEVRNLASRSADAAKEIKTLIESSVSQIHAGSTLVEKAGATMTDVVNSVRRVTDIMDEISAASQEQSDGIEQVSQAIGQMDQVTQQNAALVQQASAAAASLEEQANRLEQAVAVFQLLGSQTPQPALASPKAPAPAQKTSAPRPVTRSQTATSSHDDWEEF